MTGQKEALDRTLISGLGWSASGRWAGQLISWSSTLVVLRFLSPADYGLVAMGGTLFALITVLGDGGIRTAIVSHGERTPATLHQLTTVSVLLGVAGTLVALALAFPLALFFREPRLVPIVIVAGMSYTVLGFRMVPLAVLQRDLAFRTIAMNDLIMVTVGAITSVAIAWQGGGYWALIVAHVAGVTAATATAWRAAPQKLARPHWAEVRASVLFGNDIVISSIAHWLRSSADTVIIGRWLGQKLLGSYRVAMDFASLPLEKVASVILQVTFPVFSAVRNDKAALTRYLLLLTEGLAMLTWPLATGLIVVADLAVPVILGKQWSAAVVPLVIFSAAATVRTIAPLLNNVALALGDSRLLLRVAVFGTIITIGAMIPAARWGIPGVAVVWALSYPILTAPVLVAALRGVGLSFRRYAAVLVPTLFACLMEAGAVFGIRSTTVVTSWTMAAQLGTSIVVGGSVYLAVLAIVSRSRMRQVYTLIVERRIRGQVNEPTGAAPAH